MNQSVFDSLQGQEKDFSLLHSVQAGPFPGVKWPGHEADLSPPYSNKIKNGRTVPKHLYDLLIKCRDNFLLYNKDIIGCTLPVR
jgi:hypothetical protein